MGHGIAQVLAAEGMDVVVHDPVPEVLASVRERIATNLRSLGEDPESRIASPSSPTSRRPWPARTG